MAIAFKGFFLNSRIEKRTATFSRFAKEKDVLSMGMTFFDKVWDHHVISLQDTDRLLQIDRLLLHDQGGTALRKLQKSGRAVACPSQVFTFFDHLVETRPGRGDSESSIVGGSEMIRSARSMAKEYGFSSYDIGNPNQGIIHVVATEQGVALPGLTVACADSHVCTVGGIGAVGIAISATEGEHILATQTLALPKPRNMRISLSGHISSGLTAKDIALHIIGQIGASGGIGYAVEFSGSAVSSMSIEGRLTLCNLAIDFSANCGFVAPDESTIEYVRKTRFSPKGKLFEKACAYWMSLRTDPDAIFDREIDLNVSDLAPHVTWGTSLDHVIAIDEPIPDPQSISDVQIRRAWERAIDYMKLRPGSAIDGIQIDVAYIGSCTNSRISDLRSAAAVLKGRKIAPGVVAICVPGSTSIKREAEAEGLDVVFKDAGFEWHESGCGMCSADGRTNFSDRRVISTTNRNFEGRQGPRTKTHLASPATVAASSIAGAISDPRKYHQ